MPDTRKRFGRKSESVAAGHLKKNGYRILEQNYRNKLGEIDIIAKDKDTIVFVDEPVRLSAGEPRGVVGLLVCPKTGL